INISYRFFEGHGDRRHELRTEPARPDAVRLHDDHRQGGRGRREGGDLRQEAPPEGPPARQQPGPQSLRIPQESERLFEEIHLKSPVPGSLARPPAELRPRLQSSGTLAITQSLMPWGRPPSLRIRRNRHNPS